MIYESVEGLTLKHMSVP